MHLGRHVTIDGFFGDAPLMRRVLDRRLSDRSPPFDPARFAWERWHVDGQFSQLRTPARGFFPPALMEAFEARLLRWASGAYGVSRLGGPPWLSVLVDGDFQALHRDGPNGQIAFTFGLGRAARFRGGETLIARDDLLDYFRAGAHREGQAHMPLFDEIASRLNRLVTFDSRIPHAVRAVEGPRGARDGRIAVQGWLAAAGCVAAGEVLAQAATHSVNAALAAVPTRALRGAEGLVAIRLAVGRNGQVRSAELRSSTLATTGREAGQPARALAAIMAAVARARFDRGPARVTAPVVVSERARARVPLEIRSSARPSVQSPDTSL